MPPRASTVARERAGTTTPVDVVDDRTAGSRCDEGFLQVRRLRCRNLRADGTRSPEFRVDVVDRPRLDAVAVLVYRQFRSDMVAT